MFSRKLEERYHTDSAKTREASCFNSERHTLFWDA